MENMKHNYLASRQHRRVFDIIGRANLLKVSCSAVLIVKKIERRVGGSLWLFVING